MQYTLAHLSFVIQVDKLITPMLRLSRFAPYSSSLAHGIIDRFFFLLRAKYDGIISGYMHAPVSVVVVVVAAAAPLKPFKS